MKYIIILLLITSGLQAQVMQERNTSAADRRIVWKNGMRLPQVCNPSGVPDLLNYSAFDGKGALVYDTCNNNIKWWNGSAWDSLTAGAGGFVPYVGATGKVYLGDWGMQTDHIDFTESPLATDTARRLNWDSTYGTLDFNLTGNNVNLQVGQELVVLVRNNTGIAMTDGQVVYITGSTGDIPTVALANNRNFLTASKMVGMVTEPIAHGAKGYVTLIGKVNGLNTLAFNEGDPLWVDSIDGAYTNVLPVAPSNVALLGIVVKKAGGNGSIFVRAQPGFDTAYIRNQFTALENKRAWITKIKADSVIIPTTATYDTTANKPTVADANGVLKRFAYWPSGGGGGTPGGGLYSIQYNRNGAFAGNSTFVYDSVNARVGIGKAVPTIDLDIEKNRAGEVALRVTNLSTSSGSVYAAMEVRNSISTYFGQLFKAGTNYTTYKNIAANDLGFTNSGAGNISILNDVSGGSLSIAVNAASSPQFTMASTGAITLTSSLTTANVNGSGTGLTLSSLVGSPKTKIFFGTSAYDELNNRLGIGTASPTSAIEVSGTTNDIGRLIGSSATRVTLYQQATNSASQATHYLENNRGSFASYGGMLYGGSTNATGNIFGLSRADKLLIFADGASNLGFGIGTLVNQPLYIGTNNTERMRIEGDGDIGIGTTTPAASSILDVTSTTKGFLPPRMTTTQRDAISSPANGLIIYNTTTDKLQVRAAGAWVDLH